jgi:hypothetical protein
MKSKIIHTAILFICFHILGYSQTVYLYTPNGSQVYAFQSAEQIRINTSQLPNGVYYLNMIANGEKIKQQTIIINH